MDIGLTVGDSLGRLSSSPASFDFVELAIGAESLPPAEIDPNELDDALGARDFLVHLPYDQVLASYPPEVNDAIVAYQRRLLARAAELGAERAVLHGTSADRDDLELRDVAADQLAAVVDAGRDVGVEVAVENVGHHHRGLQLSVLGELTERTGAAVCFDVGHAYMEGGNDAVKRFLKRYGDRIAHLHVHDARRRGDTHIPIGAGEIEYDLLGKYLSGFDGTVAVEVFTDDERHLLDSARRAADALGGEFRS